MVEIYIGSGIIALVFFILQLVVLATVIDIGVVPIGRTTAYVNYTLINKANPANATGKITSIEVWVTGNCNLEVATFYQGAANYFTTRDSETLMGVTAGAKRTFEVDLNVVEGDFIGCFSPTGGIAGITTTDGEGVWYKSSDRIPCENLSFSLSAAWVMDLYGTGTTEVAVAKKNVIFFGSNF